MTINGLAFQDLPLSHQSMKIVRNARAASRVICSKIKGVSSVNEVTESSIPGFSEMAKVFGFRTWTQKFMKDTPFWSQVFLARA
jgi:hypothetical protein